MKVGPLRSRTNWQKGTSELSKALCLDLLASAPGRVTSVPDESRRSKQEKSDVKATQNHPDKHEDRDLIAGLSSSREVHKFTKKWQC